MTTDTLKNYTIVEAVDQVRRILPPVGTSTVMQLLQRVTDLPTLPGIVERIFALTSSSGAGAKELADLVSKDIALTSRILKLANSAYYAPTQEIRTIEGAVMMIGFDEVRHVCAATRLVQSFPRMDGFSTLTIKDFWLHSLAAAEITKLIARRTAHPQVDEMFFAGLLHDFGKLIIHHAFPKHFVVISALAMRADDGFYEIENQVLGVDHSLCGGEVARNWHLPSMIGDVIRYHHNVPPKSSIEPIPGRECAMVHLADFVSHAIFNSPYQPTLSPVVWEYLPVNLKDGMENAWGQGERITDYVRGFF